MKRIVLLLGILLIGVVLFACAPKAMPAVPVEEKPSEVAAPITETGWEAEWEKVLREARKEGRVVVYGAPIVEVRRAFTEVFQKAYPGIMLEYTGMRGAEVSPKIKTERRAGLYVVDLQIGGTTTILTELRDFAVPIKPHLILPDVKYPKVWLEGKLDFSDDAEKINLVFSILASDPLAYNSELVKPGEITSYWDLTHPKWKGKLIMQDPRTAGKGLADATFWYFEPKLGLDFIRAFADNKPLLVRDLRFQVEAVARGKYYIAVGPQPEIVTEFQKAGLPINFGETLKEGTHSSPSFGSVIFMDKAPHPNAATVFLNWLLGKEGQTVWSTASGYASRRLDIPTEHVPEVNKPKPGVSYFPGYKESIVMKRDELASHLNKIFAGF